MSLQRYALEKRSELAQWERRCELAKLAGHEITNAISQRDQGMATAMAAQEGMSQIEIEKKLAGTLLELNPQSAYYAERKSMRKIKRNPEKSQPIDFRFCLDSGCNIVVLSDP